jgi:hypothetical protein
MSTPAAASERSTNSGAGPDRIALLLGLVLLVDFLLCVVMLVTDKNLQTDFGGKPAYYAHWYGVLAMALVDLVGALVVLAASVPSVRGRMPSFLGRNTATVALGWSVLAILAMVGIVESYSEVGFSTANQFAQYLFGVTAYPGVLSYIPWLYDLLLVLYVVTAAVAGVAFWQSRRPTQSAAAV